MNRFQIFAVLMFCAMTSHAQEMAMCLQRTDGSQAVTRVAELSKITFLSIADQGRGLVVTTTTSTPVTVLFEEQPELTVSKGKLLVATKSADAPVEIEINDIAEIKFDKAGSSLSAPGGNEGIVCVLQSGAALFRGIPKGLAAQIYTIDGRNVPAPACVNGELRLSRATLGTGIYIVCIGTFTTKVSL